MMTYTAVMKITVDKDKLLETLRANRAKHHSTYLAAVEVYRRKATALAAEQTELLLRGEIRAILVNLPVPEEHTDDYDRVIAMLEWDLGDTYELDEGDFNQYVLDVWGWGQRFFANSTSYLES